MDSIQINDESGDKKYFTIIPNYIYNHSTANDQALYGQMKRLAGENGICEAGYRYFVKQLGIGYKAYKKSLTYLLEHKWIKFVGQKEVVTAGGKQLLYTYQVNDIWKMNNEYYQGGAERKHLSDKVEVVSEESTFNAKVVSKENAGGAERKQKKELLRKNNIADKSAEEIFSFDDSLSKMMISPRLDAQIIGLYWQKKGWTFSSKEQMVKAYKREVKPANELKHYPIDDIKKTFNWLDKKFTDLQFHWTLETVLKYINEINSPKMSDNPLAKYFK